jgi:hypothetical protein
MIENQWPELAESVEVVGNERSGDHGTYRCDDHLAGEAVRFVLGTEQVANCLGKSVLERRNAIRPTAVGPGVEYGFPGWRDRVATDVPDRRRRPDPWQLKGRELVHPAVQR